MAERAGRVLVIAASDSGGGAGLQGDVKTVTMLGGYASTAVTAITVQNSLGVSQVHALPAELVRAQLAAILADVGADAIKTGALISAPIVACVAEALAGAPGAALVIDPVIAPKAGRALLSARGVEALRRLLVPLAALVTPNAPEAAILSGRRVESLDQARTAAEVILEFGAGAVLIKGGHLQGERVVDLLVTPTGEWRFESPRVAGRHTHGTGCALASACATGLGQGLTLEAAAKRAHTYVLEAIRRAPGFGAGAGPIDHAWPIRPA